MYNIYIYTHVYQYVAHFVCFQPLTDVCVGGEPGVPHFFAGYMITRPSPKTIHNGPQKYIHIFVYVYTHIYIYTYT